MHFVSIVTLRQIFRACFTNLPSWMLAEQRVLVNFSQQSEHPTSDFWWLTTSLSALCKMQPLTHTPDCYVALFADLPIPHRSFPTLEVTMDELVFVKTNALKEVKDEYQNRLLERLYPVLTNLKLKNGSLGVGAFHPNRFSFAQWKSVDPSVNVLLGVTPNQATLLGFTKAETVDKRMLLPFHRVRLVDLKAMGLSTSAEKMCPISTNYLVVEGKAVLNVGSWYMPSFLPLSSHFLLKGVDEHMFVQLSTSMLLNCLNN